jgi:phosphate transport system ATP-binding protein
MNSTSLHDKYRQDTGSIADEVPIKLRASRVYFRYGGQFVLHDVTVLLFAGKVTAFIGPSGCGKSTLLRVFNRMHDLYRHQHAEGEVFLDDRNILSSELDAAMVRRRVGMVFQQITAFPMSIYDNVAFGIRNYGEYRREDLGNKIELALRRASLWDEVKDILSRNALSLSGGQQQRLCIARALAVEPEVLLLDEPCSALDPISTARIEETIVELKDFCTIAIVTHNLQQAARISDYTAFMYLGKLIEFGTTEEIFSSPKDTCTQAFVQGRFG